MIIYEVNLKIEADIYSAYREWLDQHIKDLLEIEGFQSAQIELILDNSLEVSPSPYELCVRYFLKDRQSLRHYLENHAAHYRQDGINRFGQKFQASRRVLEPA